MGILDKYKENGTTGQNIEEEKENLDPKASIIIKQIMEPSSRLWNFQ